VTALLQFEVDKKRLNDFAHVSDSDGQRTPSQHVLMLARLVLRDTFENGGTFVVVVSADKITMVQRAEAEDLPEKKPDLSDSLEEEENHLCP
jgi:hypothetical protein